MKFGPKANGKWRVTLPARYQTTVVDIQTGRIEAAGARLAQILVSIWQ